MRRGTRRGRSPHRRSFIFAVLNGRGAYYVPGNGISAGLNKESATESVTNLLPPRAGFLREVLRESSAGSAPWKAAGPEALKIADGSAVRDERNLYAALFRLTPVDVPLPLGMRRDCRSLHGDRAAATGGLFGRLVEFGRIHDERAGLIAFHEFEVEAEQLDGVVELFVVVSAVDDEIPALRNGGVRSKRIRRVSPSAGLMFSFSWKVSPFASWTRKLTEWTAAFSGRKLISTFFGQLAASRATTWQPGWRRAMRKRGRRYPASRQARTHFSFAERVASP